MVEFEWHLIDQRFCDLMKYDTLRDFVEAVRSYFKAFHLSIQFSSFDHSRKIMMYKPSLAISVILLTCSGVSYAQDQVSSSLHSSGSDNLYAEMGYTPLNIRFSNGVSATPDVARLTLGWHAHQNLDVEIMGSSTLKKNRDIGVTMIGAYLKPKISISQGLDVFSKIGVNRIHLNGRGYGISNRASYGIGIQKKFNDNVYGQIDFTKYGVGKNRESVHGFNISIGSSF